MVEDPSIVQTVPLVCIYVCVCLSVNASRRWKRDDQQEKVKDPVTSLPILQFVAIQRRDTKEWAIPGVSTL